MLRLTGKLWRFVRFSNNEWTIIETTVEENVIRCEGEQSVGSKEKKGKKRFFDPAGKK